ncbi:hypothetical protein AN218_21685 [Streptomyces nanshensis]|uniref:Uncharacterized protein n=1 Tax=Streptomyces nanshensis TaxID=518642 RepID=A0A1E7L021_9ACTN|nr:hypothetical protein AN218_21685 [Streptomyces nanshensis]
MERGIVPFLEGALAERASAAGAGTGQRPRTAADFTDPAGSPRSEDAADSAEPAPQTSEPAEPSERRDHAEDRTPRLGYSGPDFSSRSPAESEEPGAERDKERERLRLRYSSPDYSSPDYGGPEHQPE